MVGFEQSGCLFWMGLVLYPLYNYLETNSVDVSQRHSFCRCQPSLQPPLILLDSASKPSWQPSIILDSISLFLFPNFGNTYPPACPLQGACSLDLAFRQRRWSPLPMPALPQVLFCIFICKLRICVVWQPLFSCK
jgi:hypothetical protein